MTDTITPSQKFRITAEVLRSAGATRELGNYVVEAAWCEDQAARLEAESARDKYVETLAISMGAAVWQGIAWDLLPPNTKRDLVVAARTALDFLAADGRLLPEGGTATVASAANVAAEQPRHRELDRCRYCGRHRNFCPDACVTPPAASVPDPCCAALPVHGVHDPWCPIVSVPDSGPDGTPEKPWEAWQDVPAGVEYAGVGDGGRLAYVNYSGTRYLLDGVPSFSTDSDMTAIAPFVRVDGDKA